MPDKEKSSQRNNFKNTNMKWKIIAAYLKAFSKKIEKHRFNISRDIVYSVFHNFSCNP